MKTKMRWRAGVWWVLLLFVALASSALAQDTQKVFKKEQLDQWLAPIALYPDALLSQILMAATYPGDITDAAAWSKAHTAAKGDAAVKQVAGEKWDPSVQSLVAFPEVLVQMAAHPEWVQNVGDAFLAQPDDVMAAVQRLRGQAQKAGHLQSTEQQKVVVQQSTPETTIIQIQPADPQVVYVPSYNPTVVYGAWAYPAYPPPYWPPPPGYYHPVATGVAAGLAFGAGVAIADSLWGGFDWGHGDVHVDVNHYNNINVNNRISGNGNVGWNHNPANRRGTPYRDPQSRQQFGQGVPGADSRSGFRGHDASRDASRQQAMQSFDRRTNNGSSPAARGRPGSQGGGVQHAPGNNAFAGVRSKGALGNAGAGQRQQAGAARTMSAPHGGNFGSGHTISRPVPTRGGFRHR